MSNKFIGLYLRSKVSVYRTIGPLVYFLSQNDDKNLSQTKHYNLNLPTTFQFCFGAHRQNMAVEGFLP